MDNYIHLRSEPPLSSCNLRPSTMATLEATLLLCSIYSSPTSSYSTKFPKPFLYSLKFHNSISVPRLSHNLLFHPSPPIPNSSSRKLCFELCSAVQEIVAEEKPEETQESNQKKKLYVVNLPWSLTVVDIKNLFGECGTVVDVEVLSWDSLNLCFYFSVSIM